MSPNVWSKAIANKEHFAEDVFTLLSKYKARRDYVAGLRNTMSTGLSNNASEAYFVLLKLALAYTAVELLKDAIGGRFSVRDAGFAAELQKGTFDKMLASMEKNLAAKYDGGSGIRTRTYLKATDKNPDLIKFVADCRNLMFHGRFTPSETGLDKSSRRRALLLGLANQTIAECDSGLNTWLEKQGAKLRNSKNKVGTVHG